MNRALLVFAASLIVVVGASWADWPQFRHDASRSGYTPDKLSTDLNLKWVYEPSAPPDPAWTGEDTRMPFDHAYHVSVADGRVFFGSSSDCKVYALDADSGEELWSFFTDSPVRFAPVVWHGKVFAAGDDGYLYCLSTKTGTLEWKKRLAPADDLLLGNGHMVSRWPVRGAVTILDDVLYVVAGIWPSEGIFIYALDPESGDVIWLNDTAGYIEMDQPHGTAYAKSGVSAQGHLAVAGNTLLLPTGRSVPAAFERDSGAFRYFHLQSLRSNASAPFVSIIDDRTFTGQEVYSTRTGETIVTAMPCATLAAFPKHIVYLKGGEIRAVPRDMFLIERDAIDRKGAPVKKTVINDAAWTVGCENVKGVSLIGAGKTIVLGTTDHKVLLAKTGAEACENSLDVDGLPLGLAACDGSLFVSTDNGTIYCFSHGRSSTAKKVKANASTHASPADDQYATAAKEILAKSGVTEGYCLDLGCGDGHLARELAQRSNLHIYAVEPDPQSVAKARKMLSEAGLYGTRVTVLERDLARTTLPNYFADLIVSSKSLELGKDGLPANEIARVQRPFGGKVCVGKPGALTVSERGPLEGAGTWTHLYCTPGNVNCSTDTILKGPLGMLWFADNDLEMPSRHGRGPGPLFEDGILLTEGLHGLRALNPYNGRVLWTYPLPNILKPYDQEHLNGVAITGSNYCVGDGRVYVRTEDRCLCLDMKTGKKLAEFKAPLRPDGNAGAWGHLSYLNGMLYGSLFNQEHLVTWAFRKSDMSQIFSESLLFFAMDAETGEVKWTYTPQHSVRNNTIAIGAGRVHLIDRPIAVRDRKPDDKTNHPLGTLLTLDAATGKEIWRATENIYGTMLALDRNNAVLVMGYQVTRFQVSSEQGGRLAAFNAADGNRMWDIKARYASRLVLNGDTIYAQSGAWNLNTGTSKPFPFSRSYGCGTIAGSTHMFAYRSATLGYWDLTADRGNENYGGIRPGCWINAIPVGGLLLLPESSNRCTCSYLIKASIALQPYGIRAPLITPAGGSSREAVTVEMLPDADDQQLRYTLDGTSPVATSPLYSTPIRLDRTATVRARAFSAHSAPSQINDAKFIIDPNIVPLDGPGWTLHDSLGGTPPASKWEVANGFITELSNLYSGDASNSGPAVERPGSLRIYTPDQPGKDGTITLEIASSDNDGLGVAFRLQDSEHYYLWAMDRQRGFRALSCKNGDEYRMLSCNDRGYESNRWYKLSVVLKGADIAVYLDGELDSQVTDETVNGEAFALYAWGCAGAKYRNVKWEPAP